MLKSLPTQILKAFLFFATCWSKMWLSIEHSVIDFILVPDKLLLRINHMKDKTIRLLSFYCAIFLIDILSPDKMNPKFYHLLSRRHSICDSHFRRLCHEKVGSMQNIFVPGSVII